MGELVMKAQFLPVACRSLVLGFFLFFFWPTQVGNYIHRVPETIELGFKKEN